jgi:oxygen-dependent protoporphyrinogen oxidase
MPMPKLSLLGIPGSPLAADVLPILGNRAAFRAFFEALLPGTYAANSVTLGELVRKRMGDQVLERLVAPIVRGVHSADPDELDLDTVAPGLRAAMRRTGSLARAVLELRTAARAGSSVAGVRGGLNRIVTALTAELERFGVDVRLQSRATAIEPGRVTVGGETLTGRIVVAAPGLLGESTPGHLAVLTTLVLDEPRLDSAPRGTGVLVAAGAPGIHARALTHATAKWDWLAEAAEGKHVVRLSYGERLDNHQEVARADASALLGIPLSPESVLGYARVGWTRPARQTHTPEGISLVGETASGTGLAAVIGHAEKQALAVTEELGA